MKNLILSSIAVLGTAGTAMAGSLAEPVVAPVPVKAAPIAAPNWTGGYVGVALTFGKAQADAQSSFRDGLASLGYDRTIGKPEETTGSVRVGYDVNLAPELVAGAGVSYDFGDYSDKKSFGGSDLHTKVEDLTTLYARLGYNAGKWMPYALVGYSWANGKASYQGASVSKDLHGGTLGLGAEYRFTPHLSGIAEWTYTDFDKVSDGDSRVAVDMNRANLGLNYRF